MSQEAAGMARNRQRIDTLIDAHTWTPPYCQAILFVFGSQE